jgi:hypothetical protein
MNRKLKLVTAMLAISAVTGGVAAAASSPSVSTSSATSIKTSSAEMRGTVNPNGASTTYQFELGFTKDAYQAFTALKPIGSGTTAKSVSFTTTGLLPGTTYHYRLLATNRFGSTTGADRSFKSAGHPPPVVATGGVTSISSSGATLTGIINPNGVTTSYFFQYGLTAAYTSQTVAATLPANSPPVPVAVAVGGLSAFTSFHYRLVAVHSGVPAQPGADQSFVTFPSPRFVPSLPVRTKPGADKSAPYVFTTTGTVKASSRVPAALACVGDVTIRFFNGNKNISFGLVPVQPNCTFSSQVSFNRLPGRGSQKHRIVHLRVRIFFRGNGYVAGVNAKTHTVTLGKS